MLEIHIISNRPKLDTFIRYFENVNIINSINITIKVLMLDYSEKKFQLKNNINVEYIKQKTFSKTTHMNQAWARNELLCHLNSDTKYVLFYDDWQRPDENLLIEHLKYLTKGYLVCGTKNDCDKDGQNCQADARNVNVLAQCGYGYWWTANASASVNAILKVNGFDNRYNGGSAGEDYDMAMRIERLGQKILYNPKALSYHYSHDHLSDTGRIDGTAHRQGHNLSPYKNIPEYEHNGDWDLMESDQFELWWEGSIKYWKCKICGEIGILDSIQVYYFNRDHSIIEVENGLKEVKKELK